MAIAAVAILVDLVSLLVEHGPLPAALAVLVSLAGVVLAWVRPWLGLGLTLAGCLLAALVGWDPTALWTVVIYTIFSTVLAGVPATVAGIGCAAFLYVLLALRAEGRFSDPVAVTAIVAASQREVEREVVEERLRIARDLHDLVGHEVAVLNMQIGVAEVSLPADADRSRRALVEARSAVQSVLQETQQILTVLRQDQPLPVANQPIPGVNQVPELVESFSQIGLDVDARLDPSLAERAYPTTGLATYRIIQEALTNAHRYGKGTAQLTTTIRADTVIIMIVNEIPDHRPNDRFDVVGESSDGIQAVRDLSAGPVDVVLMDIRMPGIDGVEATRRIRARWPADKVKIIVLTTFDQDENVLAALRAGANGFLSKGVGPTELADSIEEVIAGGGALSGIAAAALIGHVADQPTVTVDHALAAAFDALTDREREIAIAVATGKSNTEVAAEMYLSPFTVKTHVNRAMMKLGAHDRAQLVAYIYRAGLAG